MTSEVKSNGSQPAQAPSGITQITVGGFKSIAEEQSIEIRPLTLLAGANSSGKSSIMQPLLLMKQTIQATYDPGALLLDGPNARYTSADQLLSCITKTTDANRFSVGVASALGSPITVTYKAQSDKGFEVERVTIGETEQTTFYLG